ncbi:MAG TPA: peptide deformylase [Bryobacteraceae bacterium]|nr:peptide deformylase [Bryobacteraceae bacterium]
MKLKITQVGDPVLRQQAKPLDRHEIDSREIQQLIEWMRETMHDAPGVGLAAPQIGLPLQLAVIEDKSEYMRDALPETLTEREREPVAFHVILNPRITLQEGEAVEFFEGCLSLQGFTALTPRARRVKVDCLDHRGEPKVIEAAGWYARILQHEIDHLHGTLYVDRMYPRTLMSLDNYNRHWKETSVAAAKNILQGGHQLS